MCKSSIITLLIITVFLGEVHLFTRDTPKSVYVCFDGSNSKMGWCNSTILLCNEGFAYKIFINVTFLNNVNDDLCKSRCSGLHAPLLKADNLTKLVNICSSMKCNMTDFLIPANSQNSNMKAGLVNVTYSCTYNTDAATIGTSRSTAASSSIPKTPGRTTETKTHTTSTFEIRTSPGSLERSGAQFSSDGKTTSNRYITASPSLAITPEPTTETTPHYTSHSTLLNNMTLPESFDNETAAAPFSSESGYKYMAAIVVSVVIPITIAVVVASFVLYRRGQCKVLLGNCIKGYAKHSPVRTDAYAMSSAANANLTYDLSSDVDVNSCDVDYCEIDKVSKKTDVEYSQVILKKSQVAKDPTYNHIEHFNSSQGNTEQTYNHVGDTTLKNTSLFTLQPDTYSHIGAMAKPAPEQLAEDSYAHINGVKQYDINQYDCAVFESNGGSPGGFGHQEREMKSGKEKEFNVVGPNKEDIKNEVHVSNSYFILEKHEKEA